MNRFFDFSKFTAFSLVIFLLTAVFPAAADTVIDAAEYGSLSAAIDAVPADAGMVSIMLSEPFSDEEEPYLSIPTDRGISGTAILLREGSDRLTVPGIIRICANGVPLTIGEGVDLVDASIYGGACISEGEITLPSSSLQISGIAGFVIGGGYAENGAVSNVENTSVLIGEDGQVYYEVFGGGHAFEAGSAASVTEANVTISGTADYVLGGGFSEEGSLAECVNTAVYADETARINVAMFAGGSAAGEGSRSVVGNSFVRLSGEANWVLSGDFAFDRGQTETTFSGRVEIMAEGRAENAYLGSFASDTGSYAFINTAELMNCGTVDLIFERSQSSDGADAKTMVTANFQCSEEFRTGSDD